MNVDIKFILNDFTCFLLDFAFGYILDIIKDYFIMADVPPKIAIYYVFPFISQGDNFWL